MVKRIFIASPHGFCNGVKRAVECVENILQQQSADGKAVYVYNHIVHNSFVVNSLSKRGVIFVSALDEIPSGSKVVWSAHGIPPEIERQARKRGLETVDATCPLVKKLHHLALKHIDSGHTVIFIGHANHPETVGVVGCGNIFCIAPDAENVQLPDFPAGKKISVLTQTTLCREDVEKTVQMLKNRYPGQLSIISDICYATAERQQAVKELIELYNIEKLLVIGSPSSSNSRRLCDTAEHCNVPAQLVDDPQEIFAMQFDGCMRLGLTSGASAPEILMNKALDILQEKHHFKIYEGMKK